MSTEAKRSTRTIDVLVKEGQPNVNVGVAAAQKQVPEVHPEDSTAAKAVNVAMLHVLWEGDYFVIFNGKTRLYREHKDFCYMADAWDILSSGLIGEWKTFQMLVTLRQAIRECYAQGMGLALPPLGVDELVVNGFLTQARAFDLIHHGCNTY